ncbi:hypothetical protein Tco_0132126 [Tanacetum coccineum]
MAFIVIYENVSSQCGVNLLLGTCLNCTYGNGKPVTCCGCEGPLRGGFCSLCASRDENSFDYNPNPNSFNESQNFSDYPPQPRRDISITSPKIDFLPEEFVSELDFINPILPGIDADDFDEDDFDEDDCDEDDSLNLIPSILFVLENPSSSPISVVDSDFLIEEVDTFLVPEDSIPPGIESDLGSEGDIIFSNDLLNDDPIPEYERFTFDIEPDAPVINNFDELNEDECFDPGGGEIDVEDDDSFTFVIRTFLPFLTYPVDSPLLLSTGSEDTIFDPDIST